ncbi:MAG: copper resistance protein B [Hyphomonadaceae bacterium]
MRRPRKDRATLRGLFAAGLLCAAFATPAALAQGHDDRAPHASDAGEPPWSQADAIYGAEAMDAARHGVRHDMGAMTQTMVMADRLEVASADEADGAVWDIQGWYGGDVDKLWIKSEGDYSFETDDFEEAELQALWSHAISPYFDLQTGVRYDFEPGGLAHAVVGVQGLAPYWFEVDAAAFLSTDGDLTARFEAEYDLRLTQRLILQPRAEVEMSAQDIPELGIGSGVSRIDAGFRLRYEFVREFAPYVGFEWRTYPARTGDMIAASGEDESQGVAVIGLRAWY